VIQKILIFNYTGWNQTISSLIEGLKSRLELELFSTTHSNYGKSISILSERKYKVSKIYNIKDRDAPSLYTSSIVIDTPTYIEECQELMDWADLIVIFDNNGTETSAHFYNDKNIIDPTIHQYGLRYHKDKTVMISPGDFSGGDKMYGNYLGAEPAYYKVYFKREKSLDLEWADNVETMPFSAEERYFVAGKDFDNIWKNKKFKLSALFRDIGIGERADVLNELINKYGEDENCITSNVFGRSWGKEDIDIELEGTEIGECVRHHHKYFDIITQTKINIEGRPGNTAFYTVRMMESLANGCCYFYPTPNYKVDFPNGLVDGEDFVIYHGVKDLIEKIEYYSSHENEMRVIAENGFNKLLKYHTSKIRAKEFLQTCERYMYD